MALLDRVNSGVIRIRGRGSRSLSLLDDWGEYFTFGGNTYPVVQTTMGSVDRESVPGSQVAAYKGNVPVFALVQARIQAFSQARFQWTRFTGSQPGDLFGSPELALLERPWQGGTTSDLLARMEVHLSLAGNAYVHRARRDRLAMLRPDRVTIIMGSQTDADNPSEAPDVEVAGYIYTTSRGKISVFTDPTLVAHYAPIPDPDAVFLGMSWITPAIREMQADSLATEHKARFFTNAATPNLAIKFDPSTSLDKVRAFKEFIEEDHTGAWNAYKTLYLGGGADPVVVGKDFQQLDFAATQGKGETRLAAAASVPPSWVGFSEGLQGSSLNAGNYSSARRKFSDATMFHLWMNAATSLEVLLARPAGASLWFDARVPFMREDAKDAADIMAVQMASIGQAVKDGFTRESAVAAVAKQDPALLVPDPNWVSVQLQAGGGMPPALEKASNGQTAGVGA